MTAPVTDTPIPDADLAAAFHTEADLGLEPVSEATDAPPEADQPEVEDAPATDSTTPEPEAPEADQPPADPFADLLTNAKPLPYKVDGTERAFEHILELPDGKGGFIPADKLAEVRNLVARYESNAEATKELYAFRQQVDRLGGLERFTATQEQYAQLNKVGLLLMDAIQHPERLVAFDDQGRLVRNDREMDFLLRELHIAKQAAQFEARAKFSEQEQAWTAETSEAQVRQTAIPAAIDGLVQHFGLGPDDRDAAVQFFGQFTDSLLFKATPEQAQQFGVAPGTLMVDRPKMAAWFEDRAARQSQVAEAAKARAAAAAENAKRVAPKVAPKVTKPKSVPRNTDGTFAERQRRDPSDYFNAALAGKPTPGTTPED